MEVLKTISLKENTQTHTYTLYYTEPTYKEESRLIAEIFVIVFRPVTSDDA